MAEAHNISALSINVTHDGVSVSYDQELLRDVWHMSVRQYKKRFARFKNNFTAGIYPASPTSLLFTVLAVMAFGFLKFDWFLLKLTPILNNYFFYFFLGDGMASLVLSCLVSGVVIWFVCIQLMRISLKQFLSYRRVLYQSPHERNVTRFTELWLKILHFLAKSEPMMHAFQGALPHLPLPSLDNTLAKVVAVHLRSMRPILDDGDYNELVELSEKFQRGIGRRLQRYLYLKSWLSVNYVADWWEEFVYLRQRSPIMVNSNYYGMDAISEAATQKQAARAANITYAVLQFRRLIQRQEISPYAVNLRAKLPFCTMQYRRLFNSCRIPGEETDVLKRLDDSNHVAVLHKGRWFKMIVYSSQRLLTPAELQRSYQSILESESPPYVGEAELGALTAGERTHWARTRKRFFGTGVNKTSLGAIEKAAFVLVLDEENVYYDPHDESKLDHWASVALHGKCVNRWFDKSFNMIVSANCRVSLNVEHSCAHFMEDVQVRDRHLMGYTEGGDCHGKVEMNLVPTRLKWDISEECQAAIAVSKTVADALVSDVEMALLMWHEFGKGAIKKMALSPDAFIQMALQLTYFKDQGKFSLTYEASMTRLYREGRTETVRSCTQQSCDFVNAMLDADKSRDERKRLLKLACDAHVNLYRDAMSGKGIDRHLFALYVVKRYLEVESPFFDKVFPPSYLLSTSQTPLQQTDYVDLSSREDYVTAGGGFGPVTDNGYGVSYIIAGENVVTFHISSKSSAPNTSSATFRRRLAESLREIRALYSD